MNILEDGGENIMMWKCSSATLCWSEFRDMWLQNNAITMVFLGKVDEAKQFLKQNLLDIVKDLRIESRNM